MAKILGEYINPDMGFQEPPAVFSGADLSNYPVGRQNPFWHRQFEKIEFEGFGLVDEKDWPELIGCKEPKTLPLFIEGHPFIVVCDPDYLSACPGGGISDKSIRIFNSLLKARWTHI